MSHISLFLSGHEVDGVTYFSLDQATGYVILLQKLDREDISHFMLDIKVFQSRVLNPIECINENI